MAEPELEVGQFLQDVTWTGADRRAQRIEDMTSGHIVNAVAYVQRRAAPIHYLLQVGGVLDGVGSMEDRVEDPLAWLNETPVMRKFKAVLLARGEEVAW